MKKRIKEIALQVGGSHYPDVGGELLQKFADQLIAECIDVIRNTPTSSAYTTFDMGVVKGTIEKSIEALQAHFKD